MLLDSLRVDASVVEEVLYQNSDNILFAADTSLEALSAEILPQLSLSDIEYAVLNGSSELLSQECVFKEVTRQLRSMKVLRKPGPQIQPSRSIP